MKIRYEFDPPVVDLIIEGLSELPHKRVGVLIAAMTTIAREQLQGQAAEAKRSRKKPAASLPEIPAS